MCLWPWMNLDLNTTVMWCVYFQFLWHYKRNLTMDFRFGAAATDVCGSSLKLVSDVRVCVYYVCVYYVYYVHVYTHTHTRTHKVLYTCCVLHSECVPTHLILTQVDCANCLLQLKECDDLPKGQLIPCLMEHRPNITDGNCRQFLTRIGSLVFSDYRMVYNFMEDCGDDVQRFQCGRVEEQSNDVRTNATLMVDMIVTHYKNDATSVVKGPTYVICLGKEQVAWFLVFSYHTTREPP